MKEYKVNSWEEIHKILFINSEDKKIKRFRSPYAFRGLSNKDYNLMTSLIRLRGKFEETEQIKKIEQHLLRNFRKYASRNLVEYDSIWHWLALAQHHGLPTRLLDWTFSPYVALHFATANRDCFDKEGIIWAVNYNEYHDLLPKDSSIAENKKKEGADLFTVEILAKSIKNLEELEKLRKDPFIIFFEPPSIDDRIVNQSALFSISSTVDLILDEFFNDFPIKKEDAVLKIIIPANLKWEIRDKLDQSNITERVLFPGLDGLSQWLNRYYCPKEITQRESLNAD